MTLFSGVDFDEHRTRIARTRDKSGALDVLPRQLPQFLHERHPHESRLGHLIRRVHRRFFASGDFALSRSLPELTVLVAGRRSDRPDLLP